MTVLTHRAGSWWHKKLPNPLPSGALNVNNSTWLTSLKAGADTFNSFRIIGGVGNDGAFATPVAWATSTDPLYTILANDSSMVAGNGIDALDVGAFGAQVFPSNQARIPATVQDAFTPSSANTGSDREFMIVNQSAGYVANLSKAYFWPAGTTIPGHGTSPSPNGTWSCKGSQIAYLSSYGFDYTGATAWPTGLRFYADDPRNDGNHRGNNAIMRVYRWDEYQDGAINHPLEMYAAQAGFAGDQNFPMTGSESAGGVPEGLRVHIKFGTDLAAKLNWIIASAGQAAYDQAMIMAVALRDYGFYVGDNSGGPNAIKIEANEKESNKSGRLWTLPMDAFKNFNMSTDFEAIAMNYDPPASSSSPPPPGTTKSVTVAWTETTPASGLLPYQLTITNRSSGATVSTTNPPATATTATVNGLAASTTFDFALRAQNTAGYSAPATGTFTTPA